MLAKLGPLAEVQVIGLRSVSPADDQALATLMLSAFKGTIDYEGEDQDDALSEVQSTLDGSHGPFLENFSHVVVRDGKLASSVLITRWCDDPFVAFTMTGAPYKRSGLAKQGMLRAMGLLHSAGESQLRLLVTVANQEAVALYRSLGFGWEE